MLKSKINGIVLGDKVIYWKVIIGKRIDSPFSKLLVNNNLSLSH